MLTTIFVSDIFTLIHMTTLIVKKTKTVVSNKFAICNKYTDSAVVTDINRYLRMGGNSDAAVESFKGIQGED